MDWITIGSLIVGGIVGYRIGREVGYKKGRDFLLNFVKRCYEAEKGNELQNLKSELNNKLPPIIDFTRDMQSDPKCREVVYILPKYRDILLRELKRGMVSYKTKA